MASLRRHHRRCAQDIAARMSLLNTEDRTPDVSSRPKVSRSSISRARGSTKSAAVACSSRATGTVCPHHSEGNTIRALMELALPKFDGLGDRPTQARKPWMVSTDSPASLDTLCLTDLVMSPSPCLSLDALSSDDAEESVKPRDISVTLPCSSEDGHTPVNSEQVLSDVDLPTAAGSSVRRQVFRTHDRSPVDWNVGHPKDSSDERMQHSACVQTSAPEVRSKADNQRLSAAGPSPVVGSVDIPEVGWVETIQLRGRDSCPLSLLRRSPSGI